MSLALVIPIPTHYYQFDQQGVAFNMWYLAFVEQARNEYLDGVGYPLGQLLASGHDIQLVHAEINWTAALRYGDPLLIAVDCDRIGKTSFSLFFDLTVRGEVRAKASVVYVIVDADVHGKAELPLRLRGALEHQTRP